MAGRDTPPSLPTTKTAAAMAAPVEPADTIPSASPLATRRAATVTDASFLSRMADAASSPMLDHLGGGDHLDLAGGAGAADQLT